jgi:hypothetical protein
MEFDNTERRAILTFAFMMDTTGTLPKVIRKQKQNQIRL